MGSKIGPKIPIIDFSKEALQPGTSLWISTCKDVRQALEDCGCFVAEYNDFSLDVHNAIFDALREMFQLPTEIKMQNIHKKPYHGYIGQNPIIPLYEGLGIDDPTNREEIHKFAEQLWPQGNDRLCESVHRYAKLVAELDQTVTRMVFESYGVDEKLHESHVGSTTHLLRMLRYREPNFSETDVGFIPHTDKSFTSILHQNHVNGLEILSKDGEWIQFEASPSSFVFMAGDIFMAWSNDRIRPCTHRVVISPGNETRYALGFFTFRSGTTSVPDVLVDDQHPLLYKPFDHFKFIDFFDTKDGRKADCPIKAYCGH